MREPMPVETCTTICARVSGSRRSLSNRVADAIAANLLFARLLGGFDDDWRGRVALQCAPDQLRHVGCAFAIGIECLDRSGHELDEGTVAARILFAGVRVVRPDHGDQEVAPDLAFGSA